MVDDRWYLVHAKTRDEAVADVNLRRQGYTTFFPQERKVVRHARKTSVKMAAVFPGYLFVSLDLKRDQWRPINSTFGVLRLVRTEERPIAAPRGLVEGMIAATRSDGVFVLEEAFAVGDKVRVRRGPFEDFLAEVVGLTPPDRLKILFDVMQTQAAVEIAAADVVKTFASLKADNGEG